MLSRKHCTLRNEVRERREERDGRQKLIEMSKDFFFDLERPIGLASAAPFSEYLGGVKLQNYMFFVGWGCVGAASLVS